MIYLKKILSKTTFPNSESGTYINDVILASAQTAGCWTVLKISLINFFGFTFSKLEILSVQAETTFLDLASVNVLHFLKSRPICIFLVMYPKSLIWERILLSSLAFTKGEIRQQKLYRFKLRENKSAK